AVLPGHDSAIVGLDFEQDGTALTSRSESGQVIKWNIAKREKQEARGANKEAPARLVTGTFDRPNYSSSCYGQDIKFRDGNFALGGDSSHSFGCTLSFRESKYRMTLNSNAVAGGTLFAFMIDDRFSLASYDGKVYLIDHLAGKFRRFFPINVSTITA